MKLGLLICTFNRPEYLKQCLDSIKRADLSQVDTLMIIDDCSTDKETIRLINDFELDGVNLIKAYSKENRSIKGSLLYGCDLLFNSMDVVTNLDSDAIVRSDFIEVILKWKERFPEHIVTGFNCVTRNKDGSVRHKILGYSDGYNWKASVGGLNMCFNKKNYDEWVRPSLIECLESGGNWDHKACIASSYSGKFIICAVPSVVQHIGIDSSMNHGAGGEPMDKADDFFDDKVNVGCNVTEFTVKSRFSMAVEKNRLTLILDNVTLISVDDNIEAIIKAADISCSQIRFAEVKLLSSTPSADPRSVLIRHIGSKKEYSIFMMKEVIDYIDTPYFITIQADGYILDGVKFKKDWFNYDYIGSPWYFHTDYMKVGNGAMSFRSKILHQILKDDPSIIPTNDEWIKECQEDHNICRIYRPYLESKYGIKFAPVDVAEEFSIEAYGRQNKKYNNHFGFHGKNVDFSDAKISHIPY